MEKRNTLLLTVIAIATLLVAVVGATFAYFATTQNIDANVAVNVQTATKAASFISSASGDLNITVEAHEMQEGDADNEHQSTNTTLAAGLTDTETLTVKLSAAAEDAESKCTYDIIYTWSSPTYTIKTPNPAYVSEEETPTINPEVDSEPRHYFRTSGVDREFTIAGTAEGKVGTEEASADNTTTEIEEINFDEPELKERTVTINGESKKVDYFVLVEGATIVSSSTTVPTEITWTFTAKFYNANKNQSALMEKNFAGKISVDNIKC